MGAKYALKRKAGRIRLYEYGVRLHELTGWTLRDARTLLQLLNRGQRIVTEARREAHR